MRITTAAALLIVKLLHTIAWTFFASCVIVIPVLTWTRHDVWARWAAAAVFVEVVILAVSGWACPLTPIAARYTSDRRPNFDIFLPEWLARYNKAICSVILLVVLAGMAWRLLK